MQLTPGLVLIRKSFFLFLVTGVVLKSTFATHIHNFYSKSTGKHGVHDLTLFVKGIKVKETVAGPMEGSPSGIVVRQVSSSRQLVNLIYNGVPSYLAPEEGGPLTQSRDFWGGLDDSPIGGDEDGLQLRECSVVKSREEVREFRARFDEGAAAAAIGGLQQGGTAAPGEPWTNGSYVPVTDLDQVPTGLRPLLKFRALKHKCFDLKRKIRRQAKADLKDARDKESHSLTRLRRSVTNIFKIPNTKWCGEGNSARSYGELGGLYGADSCCRQHDMHCPYFIRSFERKYGLFHFGLGTISHCSCDRRFKSCLKQTGTGAADVVGNVFFRIVKSQCFDFRPRKVCKKRSFWRCFKWGYEKQAVIANAVTWNT